MSHCRLGYAVREYVFRAEKEFRRKMQEEKSYTLEEPLITGKRIGPHLIANIRELVREVGSKSEKYPSELASYVAKSALRHVGILNFDQLRWMGYVDTSIFLHTCLDCFKIYKFDPTWELDGLLRFHVVNQVRTLLHPRMQPFPKRRKPELEQEIIRHAETVENPYLYLLPPEPKALPAPSIPLERKETTVTSVIASVATFGGEASGGVEHRAGKPYLTLTIPADSVSSFWKHVQAKTQHPESAKSRHGESPAVRFDHLDSGQRDEVDRA